MVEKISSKEKNTEDIELRHADTQAFVSLDGGYVTSFNIGGKEIVYPNGILEINNQEKNRGGIFPLFPWMDELEGTDLPRHGFARDLRWGEVPDPEGEELISDKALLKLEANDETKKIFPYDFETNLEVSLKENSLSYKLNVLNKDTKDMPIAPGFHPYFQVPEGELAGIETNINGFDSKNYKLGETLIFPLKNLKVSIPEIGNLEIKYGAYFERKQSRLAVWTDNKNYICFEPWATEIGGFLKEDQQFLVHPKESADFTMSITLS